MQHIATLPGIRNSSSIRGASCHPVRTSRLNLTQPHPHPPMPLKNGQRIEERGMPTETTTTTTEYSLMPGRYVRFVSCARDEVLSFRYAGSMLSCWRVCCRHLGQRYGCSHFVCCTRVRCGLDTRLHWQLYLTLPNQYLPQPAGAHKVLLSAINWHGLHPPSADRARVLWPRLHHPRHRRHLSPPAALIMRRH